MKLKNVEVGQRVIIKRSTNPRWDRAKHHIGEEFEVVSCEGPDYPKDGATVLVRKCDDDNVEFWCNHKGLGRVKAEPAAKKPLKVGDRVIVKENPGHFMFPVGIEGVVAASDSAGMHKVEALGDYWFYTRDQLKRVKEKAPAQSPVPAPKRDIKAELAAAWPWPEGTPVQFSEGGAYSQWVGHGGYTLGSDGTTLPPVCGQKGGVIAYVDMNDVLLDTEYQTWDLTDSRCVSALTEQQRTGPLGVRTEGTVVIKHSKDGEEEERIWFYTHGDYRDNGDGTGTVLTLEEIFLNGLKK